MMTPAVIRETPLPQFLTIELRLAVCEFRPIIINHLIPEVTVDETERSDGIDRGRN